MSNQSDLSPSILPHENVELAGNGQVDVKLGQWFWVIDDSQDDDEGADSPVRGELEIQDCVGSQPTSLEGACDSRLRWQDLEDPAGDSKSRWLGCVLRIGSNYFLIESPRVDGSWRTIRVHVDDYWRRMIPEPNADAVIHARARRAQKLASDTMTEIQSISLALGLSGVDRGGQGSGSSLMVISGTSNIDQYKGALVAAKSDRLPQLFEQAKEAHKLVSTWMVASALPLMAHAGDMKEMVSDIDDRLLTVGLYAGFSESVAKIKDGAPADIDEKLRVMQQRLYMDEESLIDYEVGGMDFKSICDFDRWLVKPDNLSTLLPFPRCMVAMRVRRTQKERGYTGTPESLFINFMMSNVDKYTYLYIRNGEQVYRLSTEIDFGEKTFPDRAEFDPTEPMLFKRDSYGIQGFMGQSEYDFLIQDKARLTAQADQWEADHPNPSDGNRTPFNSYRWENPHRAELSKTCFQDLGRWIPFDRQSVYFDDAAKAIAKQIQEYNRIAVVIQGLFDRSEVLHPHRGAQIWTPDGFAKAIELIYDASDVIAHGEAPDFEAYQARLNESIGVGSFVVGQQDFWLRKEAERHNEANYQHNYRVIWYKPHGNPGPGRIAVVRDWKPRVKIATFEWETERSWAAIRSNPDNPLKIVRLQVPADKLLNLSAYKPGDYKIFMRDRRTRQRYLQWAPLMLAAEEFHAGNLGVES